MKAVVMAGGLGTRLRPLTYTIPKPMVPVANRPMIDHIMRLLAKNGFDQILVVLYHQAGIIRNYVGNGERWGVRARSVTTEEDLGTAGAVKFAVSREGFDGPFLIISGDIITDFHLSSIFDFHMSKKAFATITLTRVSNPLEFGIVITDRDGRIMRFLEKPSWGEVFSDTVNTGIYVLEDEVLDYIPDGRPFDFGKDLFPLLLSSGKPLYGYVATGYWKDVGNPSEYIVLHRDILGGKVDIEISGERVGKIGKDIWVGKGARISERAELEGTIIIGDGCDIGDGVYITDSVIGDGTEIEEGATVRGSVIWNDCTIGPGARLSNCIIGSRSQIRARAYVGDGAVVSNDCVIGVGSSVKPDVKIWPRKYVEDGAIVATSIVWGDQWTRSLFGSNGISGLANLELTPDLAARIGAAYGATFEKGSSVVASRDAHKASRMLNRAMMSGILSTGVNVFDLGVLPAPVVRYHLGTLSAVGGYHIRRCPQDPDMVNIRFFDSRGLDIPPSKEKEIERLFYREDFRRVMLEETGELSFPSYRVIDQYREGYMNGLDVELIRSKGMTVVMDYGFGSASLIFPSILGDFGCDVISLNAYLDTSRSLTPYRDVEEVLRRISNIVTTVGADVGFLFEEEGERLFMVDEKGNIYSGHMLLSIVSLLFFKTSEKRNAVAVPIIAPTAIEIMADAYGFDVIRTKTGERAMMEAAAGGAVSFLGDMDGGFIFPSFHPSFDAMFAVGKILEMMGKLGERISVLMEDVPRYEMVSDSLPCSWEMKGMIMRKLLEETSGARTETIDGIKVFHEDGWVALIPDSERPLFHVWAEASSKDRAKELANIYIEMVKEWQR
jgi:mannose-1-phosphate guanylyltransferase/phosphomannomutase